MERGKASPFARALRALLENTDLFDKKGWAAMLRLTEPAISQWVTDRTIPRPHHLRMILTTLEDSSDIPKKPLEDFRRVAAKRATDVSPHGARMLPTVAEYISRPVFSELSTQLAKLPPSEQEALLRDRYPEIRGTVTNVARRVEPQPIHTSTESAEVARSIALRARDLSRYQPAVAVASASRMNFVAPQFYSEGDKGQSGHRLEWPQVMRHHHVLITGAPGTGKTSLLQYVMALGARSFRHRDTFGIPIYLAGHQLQFAEGADALWHIARAQTPDDLTSDNAWLLVDGFDELPRDGRLRLAGSIAELVRRSPETRLAITSRPTQDLVHFGDFHRYRIDGPSEAPLLVWACQETAGAFDPIDLRWADSLVSFASCLKERPEVFRAIKRPRLLAHAAQQFAMRRLGPCDEVELLNSCAMLLWNDWRETRQAHPWRQRRIVPQMQKWWARLSFHSLIEQRDAFTEAEALAWTKHASEPVVEGMLEDLEEATGFVEATSDGAWRFVEHTYRDLWAAQYIVEGSRGAYEYLDCCKQEQQLSNVLPFACGLTQDAGPLLRYALDYRWTTAALRVATIAEMLAQQLTAEPDILEESSRGIVEWMEAAFEGWSVEGVARESDVIAESPLWQLAARSGQRSMPEEDAGQKTRKVLHALHRGRNSPAKAPLERELRASSNRVVNAMAESLDVNGVLESTLVSEPDSAVLIAAVKES